MDKGYHLLKALGFEEMARQARSTKESSTSQSCLEYIVRTAKEKNVWDEVCGIIEAWLKYDAS